MTHDNELPLKRKHQLLKVDAKFQKVDPQNEIPALKPAGELARRSLSAPSANDVLQLQRLLGNRAVSKLLKDDAVRRAGIELAVVSTLTNGNPVIQRDLDADFKSIREYEATVEDPLLKRILNEILLMAAQPNVTTEYGKSPMQSEIQVTGQQGVDRAYRVIIDAKQIKDPLVRESYIIHELLHAVADQKYAINTEKGNEALNVLTGHEKKELDFMYARVAYLGSLIESERGVLGEALAGHFLSRLPRAEASAIQEFDTIISELYYVAMRAGMSQETQSFQELKKLAEAAYIHRNEGVSIMAAYGEPEVAKKGSCCFITTACVQARGLPDDCEELVVLRAFRDDYVRRQKDGEELIAAYYRIAPNIVAAINARRNAAVIYEQLYDLIAYCVQLVKDQQAALAFEVYRAMVLRLQERLLAGSNLVATTD